MKNRYLLALLAVAVVFIFLRIYTLDTSLLFFNDIGRDYWVLYTWQQTHKPPLLGPQTSALPYNQSAVYFYMLLPFFVLTGQSPYASVITICVYSLAGFGLLYYLTQHQKIFHIPILSSLLLISIHPQIIIQNRFVWNPSFLPITLLIAVVAWLLLLESWKLKYLVIFALSITLAVSLNYSAGPALIAFGVISALLLKSKTKVLQLIVALGGALFFFNFPTIVFEIRHKFLLTNLLLHGEKLPQTATGWLEKAEKLFSFSFTNVSLLLLIAMGLYLVIIICFHFVSKKPVFVSLVRPSVLLFITTIAITLLVPISIQAHYIFAVLTIGIFTISLLRPRLLIPLLLLCVIAWLQPNQAKSYFAPVYRTFGQSLACAQQICSMIDKPTYVSVQSDLHPYHNGMEWKYMLARSGCNVKELDTQFDQADLMVVVVDHSQYEHGKTTYNELTQFGPSTQLFTTTCSEYLWATIIQR